MFRILILLPSTLNLDMLSSLHQINVKLKRSFISTEISVIRFITLVYDIQIPWSKNV